MMLLEESRWECLSLNFPEARGGAPNPQRDIQSLFCRRSHEVFLMGSLYSIHCHPERYRRDSEIDQYVSLRGFQYQRLECGQGGRGPGLLAL